MELSVLIPVFNQDLSALAGMLREAIAQAGVEAEILLTDDASEPQWQEKNARLASGEALQYIQLPRNVGRAAVRNRLATEARGEWLLFLDGDMELPGPDFIQKYWEQRKAPLVIGGHRYGAKPGDPELHFHWCYGSRVESKGAALRQKNPYRSFMTGNFLIRRELFQSIRFDESIAGYGHEDTLFGLEAMKRQVPVLHIDNPAIHRGLMPLEGFLQKNRQAVHNLLQIYLKEEALRPHLLRSSGLLSAFERLRSSGLLRGFDLWARWRAGSWARKLEKGCSGAALMHFSMLKLHWLVRDYQALKSKEKR